MRLRELIRSVRMCKTPTEERELINRESAWIRKEFREGTPYLRTRNMLKLLYVGLLGYPTEFGQLEVINLLSQPDFSGRRIGYLALQIIMDENDEVLTLSENRMISDMANGSPLLQAVSLNAAANVASADMSCDIFEKVNRLLDSSNLYIRRKACLVALRIVRKNPTYAEHFLERLVDIFSPSRFGHLLCSLALINECLQSEAGAVFLPRYRKLAPDAVNALKRLVLSMRVTERDIGDISDPFLQVRLLEFMRIIGKGSREESETFNDILTQIITNTDSSQSVGCAIEYECVRTIISIESDKDLSALAVKRVSEFLSNTQNKNLCFVALEVLLSYAQKDPERVLHHQSTILDCLKDGDVSIRRRALELTVQLITAENVRLLVPDLLLYIGLCAEEMREDATLRISQIIEEKYPTEEWRIEMSIKLLGLGRQHVAVGFAIRLIALISNQPGEVQARVVRALWGEESMAFDATHQSRRAFMLVALWTIGEYAAFLLQGEVGLTSEKIVELLGTITVNSSDRLIKLYGVNALMKMAARYPAVKSTVLGIFSTLMGSLDCELQQRACEYTTLLTEFPEEAAFSFSPMPPIRFQKSVELFRVAELNAGVTETTSNQLKADLDDLFGFSDQPSPQPTVISSGSQDFISPFSLPKEKVFSCANFVVSLSDSKVQERTAMVELSIQSTLGVRIENLLVQAAVPKKFNVRLAPLVSSFIEPHGKFIQKAEIDIAEEINKLPDGILRIKISYSVDGEPREGEFQI
ncbi:unnamed protein product [Phytomonas sp. Hart1]|nr:unnamed protein product [Phytomonas sp. Hart1]|eukprot:CCW67171.1 unnamed protein product [Phytomonas sp. isolate Hart1]